MLKAVVLNDVQVAAVTVWDVVECSCFFLWLSSVHHRLIAFLPGVRLAAEVHALLIESTIVEQDVAVTAVAIAIVIYPDGVRAPVQTQVKVRFRHG